MNFFPACPVICDGKKPNFTPERDREREREGARGCSPLKEKPALTGDAARAWNLALGPYQEP